MAVAGTGLDDGNLGLANAALDESRRPPRGMSTSTTPRRLMREPVAARSVVSMMETASRGNPHASTASAMACAMATQDRCAMDPPRRMQALTRANADARGVGGNVGTRLIHHGDKPLRHAHAREVEPLADGTMLEHAAHRIGKLGKGLKPRRIPTMRSGVSSRRSSRPALVPAERAASMSSAFAARIEGAASRRACAHGAHGSDALNIRRAAERDARCLGGAGRAPRRRR